MTPSSETAAVGGWVLFRRPGSYERVSVSIAQVEKVSPRIIKFTGTHYPRQCGVLDVVACLPTKELAERVRDAIGGVSGEFEHRRRAAEDERSRRVTEALTAANRQIEKIVAAALQQAETGNAR